jgi:hypothetical protein
VQAHPRIVSEIVQLALNARGGHAAAGCQTRNLLPCKRRVHGICRSRPLFRDRQPDPLRWRIRLDTGLVPDITIAVRMDETNDDPRDYYLLPSIDMTRGSPEDWPSRTACLWTPTVSKHSTYFYMLAGRTPFMEAA